VLVGGVLRVNGKSLGRWNKSKEKSIGQLPILPEILIRNPPKSSKTFPTTSLLIDLEISLRKLELPTRILLLLTEFPSSLKNSPLPHSITNKLVAFPIHFPFIINPTILNKSCRIVSPFPSLSATGAENSFTPSPISHQESQQIEDELEGKRLLMEKLW
jgi:hypothetical protein